MFNYIFYKMPQIREGKPQSKKYNIENASSYLSWIGKRQRHSADFFFDRYDTNIVDLG